MQNAAYAIYVASGAKATVLKDPVTFAGETVFQTTSDAIKTKAGALCDYSEMIYSGSDEAICVAACRDAQCTATSSDTTSITGYTSCKLFTCTAAPVKSGQGSSHVKSAEKLRLAYLEEVVNESVDVNEDVILANGAYSAKDQNFANIFDGTMVTSTFKRAMAAKGDLEVELKTYGGNANFVLDDTGYQVTCSEAQELLHLFAGGAIFQQPHLGLVDGYITNSSEGYTVKCGLDSGSGPRPSKGCHPSELPDSEVYVGVQDEDSCKDMCGDSCEAYQYHSDAKECELFGSGPVGWDQISCYKEAVKKQQVDFSSKGFYAEQPTKLNRTDKVPAIGIIPSDGAAQGMSVMTWEQAKQLQKLLIKTIVLHGAKDSLGLAKGTVTYDQPKNKLVYDENGTGAKQNVVFRDFTSFIVVDPQQEFQFNDRVVYRTACTEDMASVNDEAKKFIDGRGVSVWEGTSPDLATKTSYVPPAVGEADLKLFIASGAPPKCGRTPDNLTTLSNPNAKVQAYWETVTAGDIIADLDLGEDGKTATDQPNLDPNWRSSVFANFAPSKPTDPDSYDQCLMASDTTGHALELKDFCPCWIKERVKEGANYVRMLELQGS